MQSDILISLLKNESIVAKIYNGKTESLGKHTGSLLRVANVFYRLFNDKHPINMKMLNYAIMWHDVGKCEKSWLDNKVVKGEKDSRKALATRHELLSFLVAYNFFRDKDLSNFEKCLILMPILLHHNKFISIENNFSSFSVTRSTFLKDNHRKVEWMHGLEKHDIFGRIRPKSNKNNDLVGMIRNAIKDISNGITKEESYEIQYHCMLLCAIDQMASTEFSIEEIESHFNIKYVAPKKVFALRDYQNYSLNAFNSNVGVFIMDFRPGAGKTTITESICEKMKLCPIHGTPKNIIADDLAGKFIDGRIAKIYDMTDGDDIDDPVNIVRKKAHWFSKKQAALYTTPDNIFLMSQGYKRHFMFLRSLYNGLIIIDEYHDCVVDELRGFNLFEMVKKFNYFNIPVILMSGTTPMSFVNQMVKEFSGSNKDCHFISDRNGKLSHMINGKSVSIPDIKIENNVRGKIRFFGGTANDSVVSGFKWWDQKNFRIGYFNEVMQLVNTFVAKNEPTAVCFSSKKSIFHFIHLLHTTTQYRLWKDFAVVCSTRMVYSDYVDNINDAVSELKKKNIGKTRKYKFILCTSYTEMGVDFSVQHMIIEACFLHNLDQQLGRLNRWGEFGNNADCTIFPAFTRYDVDNSNYRRIRYGSDQNYINLVKFYKEMGEVVFDKNWYSQADIDLHYSWFVSQMPTVSWAFENTCGVYRTNDEKNAFGINGMYRDVDTVTMTENGQEFQVPTYRIDRNTNDLNIIPHPQLFI